MMLEEWYATTIASAFTVILFRLPFRWSRGLAKARVS
jgi:hypothetical protein